ncbi:hypothetical protein ABLU80_17705, partial [Klebsiella sp. CN_Kp104]
IAVLLAGQRQVTPDVHCHLMAQGLIRTFRIPPSVTSSTAWMPIRIRVTPDCIIITAQNTRELWGCAEGLSVAGVNRPKMIQWVKAFPGG